MWTLTLRVPGWKSVLTVVAARHPLSPLCRAQKRAPRQALLFYLLVLKERSLIRAALMGFISIPSHGSTSAVTLYGASFGDSEGSQVFWSSEEEDAIYVCIRTWRQQRLLCWRRCIIIVSSTGCTASKARSRACNDCPKPFLEKVRAQPLRTRDRAEAYRESIQ